MGKSVTLDEREWQQVIQILANAPWHIANPLIGKIGEQLQIFSAESRPAERHVNGQVR